MECSGTNESKSNHLYAEQHNNRQKQASDHQQNRSDTSNSDISMNYNYLSAHNQQTDSDTFMNHNNLSTPNQQAEIKSDLRPSDHNSRQASLPSYHHSNDEKQSTMDKGKLGKFSKVTNSHQNHCRTKQHMNRDKYQTTLQAEDTPHFGASTEGQEQRQQTSQSHFLVIPSLQKVPPNPDPIFTEINLTRN